MRATVINSAICVRTPEDVYLFHGVAHDNPGDERLFALAEELGNVRAACRTMGVHRSTYYRWKAMVEASGLEMLRPRERRSPRMPNQTNPVIEARVLAFAIAHPGLGPRRISATLAQDRWGGLGDPMGIDVGSDIALANAVGREIIAAGLVPIIELSGPDSPWFERMRGKSVLHPMGFDAFGLPAEEHAIKTGTHPRVQTEANIENFRRQLKMLGLSYDWQRELATTDLR